MAASGTSIVRLGRAEVKSAHLIEKMREAGFEAFQIKDGIRGLMALAAGLAIDLTKREAILAAALLAPAVRD